jgi:hypothetical protein
MILAMYLNAQVYIGTPNAETMAKCAEVIAGVIL